MLTEYSLNGKIAEKRRWALIGTTPWYVIVLRMIIPKCRPDAYPKLPKGEINNEWYNSEDGELLREGSEIRVKTGLPELINKRIGSIVYLTVRGDPGGLTQVISVLAQPSLLPPCPNRIGRAYTVHNRKKHYVVAEHGTNSNMGFIIYADGCIDRCSGN